MKNIRFHFNLYVIIPLIFGGFSTLSLLVAYRLTLFYLNRNTAPEWPLAFWGTLLFAFTYICGLIIVKFIIEPVEKFVDRTRTMGVLDSLDHGEDEPPPRTEIHQYTRVLDQVSEILGKVEARELFPEIKGQSKIIRGVLNQIIKIAPTDSTVLIIGETGTGKELVAKSIHRHSRQREKSFIPLNCAAIPEGLLESELFGHEKGAFTNAISRKHGKLELAHEGTLFLDEIGDMPLAIQAKLLRAVEEKTIVRVGGTHTIKVEARYITATNKNLPDLVSKGLFREDLFYRLNVLVIQLPPLRDRREDIPLLADHFLLQFAPDKKLASAALQLLMAYEWPGNVRELQNAIRSAAVMAVDETILPAHLPGFFTQPATTPVPSASQTLSPFTSLDLDATLREFEKNMLIQALSESRGVQKQAAKLLQIKERSLWHRLKKYELDAASYKAPVRNLHSKSTGPSPS